MKSMRKPVLFIPPPLKEDFSFAATGFEHPHLWGMIDGLRQAGAKLKSIYEPDLSNHDREKQLPLDGNVGFPFFAKIIFDYLDRSMTVQSQDLAFKAAKLCLCCQKIADEDSHQAIGTPPS